MTPSPPSPSPSRRRTSRPSTAASTRPAGRTRRQSTTGPRAPRSPRSRRWSITGVTATTGAAARAMLNNWSQYKTTIDGLDIHFMHVRSKHENALPLIITHCWPGSVIEFMKIIGPLTDPTAHGGRPRDAFHVSAPSPPGHGFSDKPTATGWDVPRIANAWIVLMRRLGYTRWVAQGGDWGSLVAPAIGVMKPDDCAAIHVNMPLVFPEPDQLQDMDAFEQAAVASLAHWEEKGSGYFTQQSTRPQTLGYGLADSPVGQAAWIYEKMWAWTDNQGNPEDALTLDEMLDNIMLYWLPGTVTSSR